MQISANGISLEVEDHGPSPGEPLLLIMGLGMQLLGWHLDFVATLVQRGFRVVRFDNRDIGLSTSFDSAGQPSLAIGAMRFALGLRVRGAYTLTDMAADCVGIVDALGIARAHVCGASMGGMIAQRMADRTPDRVKSLTLMTTSSGSRKLPGPSLRVRGALIVRPADPKSAQSIIEHYVKLDRLTGSPAYPASASYVRECFTAAVNRSHRPAGTARQLAAVAGDGDRTTILSGIRAPTHIIHRAANVLVPVQAGRDLAARIAGATLDIVEGMGHDLPRELWPRFADGIGKAAGRS